MERIAPFLLALALAGCDLVDGALRVPGHATAGSAPPAAQRAAALPDFTALMAQQGPAVVNIITTRKTPPAREGAAPREGVPPQGPRGAPPPQSGDEQLFEFFRRFIPDLPERSPAQGLASGFIISPDGFILTNAHVVAGAAEVTVRLADAKREFKAKVIGADERTDIALLKVEASGLPAVKPGDSSRLAPGEWVAAIGSPFGFANTITAGIVGAKGRSLPDEAYVPFIQTDVAVNPGNSGGPLLNLRGEVVGINSIIYSGTGGYMGVSFAIPIELAMDVAKQLRSEGRVTRGRMGVRIQPLTRELARSFGLDAPSGALISGVDPDGPAARAGLQPGDVVLKYAGKPLEDPNELPRLVAATKPGERVALEVWRNGRRESVRLTAAELEPDRETRAQAAPEKKKAETPNRLGVVVSELAPGERKALGVDYGLMVESVSGAASSQLRPGDVIVAVNRSRFASVAEFNRLVEQQARGDTVALLVRRGEGTLYVPVEIG